MKADARQLITKAKYDRLPAWEQGYAVYWQAEQPGSELRDHQANPYPPGSAKRQAWDDGAEAACLHAQDSED